MPDVAHTFRAGHRLMVQVQSSWFPLTDRNPQTFTDIPSAKPGEFRKATQRIFRSAARPSSITLLVEAPAAPLEVTNAGSAVSGGTRALSSRTR